MGVNPKRFIRMNDAARADYMRKAKSLHRSLARVHATGMAVILILYMAIAVEILLH